MATTFQNKGKNAYTRNPYYRVGKKLRTIHSQNTVTSAGAAAGDVYILGGPFTFGDKIAFIKGSTPAFTSANSNDLGFYVLNNDGTYSPLSTAAATILWSAVDLSSALSYRELLGTLNTSLDRTKNIGQLLSLGDDSSVYKGLFLGLRMNAASTATTALLDLEINIEEATTN